MSAHRVYVAACVGSLLFIIAYVLPLAGLMPELFYLPLERRWVFGAKPDGVTMDWFGRTLFAGIAGVVGAAIGAAATRGSSSAPAPAVWAGLVAALLALSLAAYAGALGARVPVPVAHPPGYQPR